MFFSLPRVTANRLLFFLVGLSIPDGNALFASNRVSVVVGSEGVFQEVRKVAGNPVPDGAVADAFAEKLSRRILVIALFVILIDVSSYFGFGGMFRGDDEARFGLIVLIAFILAFLVLLPICCAVLVRAVHNINSCQNDFIGQLKHSLVAFPYLLLILGQ